MASVKGSGALVSSVGSAGEVVAFPELIETDVDKAMLRSLPSFLMLGPPRTGSTWIYEILQPRVVLPSPTKETRFFDLHFERGVEWYLQHFPQNPDKRAVGEVAPTYFASPEACARIRSVLPSAKLIIVFRNPVQRLVSLYRLKRAYGLHAWSLDEALERDPELLGSSLYATHLKMWRSWFAPEQLSINFFDDLIADPQGFVDHICSFLGIPQFTLKQAELKSVFSTAHMTEPRLYMATKAALAIADWCKARKLDNVVHKVKQSRAFNLLIGGGTPFSKLPTESLAKVHTMLLPETEELESMVGRDLSVWKLPPAA